MDHRLFGRTDLTISPLALGTARFGWRTNAAEAAAILDLYRSQGGNLVETSAVWCRDLENAVLFAAPGEHLVGRWLAEAPDRRRGLVLAGRVFLGERLCAAPDFAARLRANCEASLERLNTEYFDLLQIEWREDFGPIERLLEALWPTLGAGGRLLYCTCSVFKAEGEQQVRDFLQRHPDAQLLPSPGHLMPGEPAEAWLGGSVGSDNLVGMDGFFYALLLKRPAG